MNGTSRLESFRADARRLLKQLRTGGDHAPGGARRLRQLQSFARYSVEELVAGDVNVQLKHALTVIATEAGFRGWTEMKTAWHPIGLAAP